MCVGREQGVLPELQVPPVVSDILKLVAVGAAPNWPEVGVEDST